MSTINSTARNKHFDSRNRAGAPSTPSIDITKEEFSRISEALKKDEFRKLFLDYCEEIQDPENRKIYEAEIKQLEAERGVDVRFVNPEPGFVVKTSENGSLKCFINIAKSAEVAKPTHTICLNPANGERGLSWSIPMAQAPPRDDLDAQNKRCRVYDVVFHPDALHLAHRNSEFRKCLIDTALDAVEREYKVKLDRANLKFPKRNYKGIARPTVIRKLAKNPPPEATEPHPLDHIYPEKPTADSGIPKTLPLKSKIPSKPDYATPKYVIKHRRGIDLTEYTEELDAKMNITVPRELVVEVELPLLSSAAECQLDVTEKSVYLLSERAGAKYRLKLDLPYGVNDKDGAARFDTHTRRLSITLPVIQPSVEQQRNMHNTVMHLNREDSGVESDIRDESSTDHSPSGSPIQEIEQNFAEDEHEEDANEDADSVSFLPNFTSETTFLNNNLPYKLPEKFDCNVLDDVMSFVLHVRNVQPDSIVKLQKRESLYLRFTSIGAGYYPNYYAFYVGLPAGSNLEIASADAEAWENNVVLNLQLNESDETLQTYLAGLYPKDVRNYSIRNQFDQLKNHQHKSSTLGTAANVKIAVERPNAETVEIAITAIENLTSTEEESTGIVDDVVANTNTNTNTNINAPIEDEDAHTVTSVGSGGDAQAAAQKKLSRKQRKRNKKQRSLSESTFDDIKSAIKQFEAKDESVTKNCDSIGDVIIANQQSQRQKQRSVSECRDNIARSVDNAVLSQPFKGILKRYSRYGHSIRVSTSDSCSSSVEDCSSLSSLINNGSTSLRSLHFSKSFSDIPEENVTGGLSESCKKTVRFNDNIQKQIFRMDSSILGQRKKNQKRRDRKHRALQRRLSEGDSADYIDDHKPITILKSPRPVTLNSKSISSNDGNNVEEDLNDESKTNGKIANDNVENKNLTAKLGKGKKKRKNAANRLQRESESYVDGGSSKGTAAMMFEIELN